MESKLQHISGSRESVRSIKDFLYPVFDYYVNLYNYIDIT